MSGYPTTTFLHNTPPPPKPLVATFKSNTLMVGQVYNVTCCIVENGPCLFSVHLETEINDLNLMMNELENIHLQNVSERPSIGMACIARYSEDGQLYRAVIMSIKPTACQVAYVDYGNTELVSFTNLYEIPGRFLEHKIFAIRFALSGYKDLEPIDDSIKNIFRDMVFQKRLKLKVMPLEGPPLVQYCELYENNINVLEALKKHKNKKLIYGPPEPIHQNDVVVIRYVESPKKFFVQNVKNIPLFDTLMDELFLHCRKSKDIITRFVKGTACAVKFENAWYRAEILGESGNRVNIRHIDFGNERSVDKSHLCGITEKLVQFPPQAVLCCLKGFENANSLSDSATVQLEMLAETTDNDRRHFKCSVMENLSNGIVLVNLIDDTIRPELNLMKRLYKLSMPFNKYIGLEKEISSGSIVSNKNFNDLTNHQKPVFNSVATVNDEDVTCQSTSDWEVNSSESGELRDSAVSPSSSQGKKSYSRNSHKDNSKRDNYSTFKNKSSIPPRFQKQKNDKGNKENQHNYNQETNFNVIVDSYSSQNNKDYQRNTTTYRGSSPSSDVIEIHEYIPFDVNLPEQTTDTPSRHEVIICWWISPHQFYTHHKKRVPDFENMMRRIQAFYKTIPPSDINPGVGANIIARYREDNILYRARILACNTILRKYRVIFTDFGNQSTVDAHDIWPIEKRFSVLPVMCHLCSFDGVVSNYDHKYITTQVEKYLKPTARLYCNYQRKENDVYFVDIEVNGKSLKDNLLNDGILSVIDQDIEIEMLLGQQIKAKIVSVKDLLNFHIEIESCDLKLMCSYNDIKLIRSNSHLSTDFKKSYEGKLCVVDVVDVSKEKILMLQPIIPLFTHDLPTQICEYPVISRSFNVKVSYVKNENILFVNPSSIENTLCELLDNMFNYYDQNGQNLEDLKVGTICAAKSSEDQNWYRARIVSVLSPNKSFEVFYVDYGNSEIITDKTRFKRLESNFCDLSALSMGVYLPLKSITENDKSVINEIKNLTSGFELNLQILERYKKKWIVDICANDYSLIDVLLDQSLVHGKDIQYVKNIIDNEKTLTEVTLRESIKDLSNGSIQEQLSAEVTTKITSPAREKNQEQSANQYVSPIETEVQEDNIESNENLIEAYLSHCDNPGRFFLQLASTYSELTKLQDNLQIVARSLPPLMSYVDGALCIALYSVDDTWYRAKILDSEIMVIQFIDYGNTDVITDNSYIKEMIEAFANIEPFAIQCALPIAPKETVDWVDEANNVFNEAYDKTVYFKYITENEHKNYIHMKVDDEDISEKLIKSKMARPLEILRSGENCFVSHINDLSDFYVQMESDSNGLELIADHLADYETFPVIEDYTEGTICAAVFPDDSQWYRAKILSRENDETNVLFIDYGNTSITSEVRKISSEIASLPFLSKKCLLRMPDHILGWSDAAEAKFRELSAMGVTVFTIKLIEPGDHAIVDLFIEDKNILDDLEQLCDKRPPTARDNNIKLTKKEKCDDRLRKTVFVSHVNSPLEFYVQLEDEVPALEEMTNELLNANAFEKLENVEPEMLCAAEFSDDGAYYRARIISHDNNGTNVLFVDFGNTAISNDLRILPKHIKTQRNYAKLCSLDDQDIDFTTQEAIDIFNSLISDGQNLECEVMREIQLLWIVKFYKNKKDLAIELAKKLNEKNLNLSAKPKQEIGFKNERKVENQELINVFVSHVNSPNDFYIQLEKEQDELNKMLDELSSAANFEKIDNPEMNNICAAIFADDGAFYRARIVSISDEGCEVLFIDYGNSSVSDDIRKLPKHLEKIEGLAKHCSLEKNIEYDINTELLNENFNSLVTSHYGETFQIEILDKDNYLWTIKLFFDKINISSKLAELVKEAAELSKPNERAIADSIDNENQYKEEHDVDSFKETEFEENITETSEEESGVEKEKLINVTLSYTNSPTDFYVQLEAEQDGLDKMLDELSSVADFEKIDNPETNNICAAIFADDGAFYRARILSTSDEGCEVLFIDYGNSSVSDDIRKLPEHLAKIEGLAKHCSLEKNTEYDINAELSNENFSSLVSPYFGQTFQIEILEKDKYPWIIKLFYDKTNITDKLIELAKEAGELSKTNDETITDLSENEQQYEEKRDIDWSEEMDSQENITEIPEDESDVKKQKLINVIVSHMNSTNDFYVQLEDQQHDLEKMTEELSIAADFDKIDDPTINTRCVANFPDDGAYYRARVVSTSDAGCEVLFTDYGNSSVSDDIRKLPEHLQKIEGLAKHCSLEKNNVYDSNAELLFNSLITSHFGEVFQIEILEEHNETWIINLYHDDCNISAELAEHVKKSKLSETNDDICNNLENTNDLVSTEAIINTSENEKQFTEINNLNSSGEIELTENVTETLKDEFEIEKQYKEKSNVSSLKKTESEENLTETLQDEYEFENQLKEKSNLNSSEETKPEENLTEITKDEYEIETEFNETLPKDESENKKPMLEKYIVSSSGETDPEANVAEIAKCESKIENQPKEKDNVNLSGEPKSRENLLETTKEESENKVMSLSVGTEPAENVTESANGKQVGEKHSPRKTVPEANVAETAKGKPEIEKQSKEQFNEDYSVSKETEPRENVLETFKDISDNENQAKEKHNVSSSNEGELEGDVAEVAKDKLGIEKQSQEKQDENWSEITEPQENVSETTQDESESEKQVKEKYILNSSDETERAENVSEIPKDESKIENQLKEKHIVSLSQVPEPNVSEIVKDKLEIEKKSKESEENEKQFNEANVAKTTKSEPEIEKESKEKHNTICSEVTEQRGNVLKIAQDESENEKHITEEHILNSSGEIEPMENVTENPKDESQYEKELKEKHKVSSPKRKALGSEVAKTPKEKRIVSSAGETELENVAGTPKDESEIGKQELVNVVLSHVNSLDDFYVQLQGDQHELEKIIKELSIAVDFEKINNPAINALCIANFADDGAFYRARILSIFDTGCEVLFIDYGNSSISNDIRKIPEHLEKVEGLAKHCSLEKNTEYDSSTELSNKNFNSLIASHSSETFQIEILEKDNDPWIIRLFYDKANISSKLVELANETVKLSKDSDEICYKVKSTSASNSIETIKDSTENEKQLKEKHNAGSSTETVLEENIETLNDDFEIGKHELINVVVSHMNSPNDFYVQLERGQRELEKMIEQLSNAADFEKMENPEINSLCAANFADDGAFYRARIISTSNAGCEILFIDYGNSSVSDDIRKLPEHLEKIEGLAKHCSLEKNIEYDINAGFLFNSLITSHFGETFQIDILEDNDPWIIKLFHDNLNMSSELDELIVKEAELSKNSDEIWNSLKNTSCSNLPETFMNNSANENTQINNGESISNNNSTVDDKIENESDRASNASVGSKSIGKGSCTNLSVSNGNESDYASNVDGTQSSVDKKRVIGSSTNLSIGNGKNPSSEDIRNSRLEGKNIRKGSDTNLTADNEKNLSSEDIGKSLWEGLHSLGIADKLFSASETNLSKASSDKMDSKPSNLNIPNNDDRSKSCMNLH